MEWSEDGLVLAARPHGESAVIVTLLTLEHGRHAGMVRGGASSRARGLYQPGNLLRATWRGRLSEHLGNFACELMRGYAGPLLDDPSRLATLGSLCAIAETALPEREPHPEVFSRTLDLIAALSAGGQDAPLAVGGGEGRSAPAAARGESLDSRAGYLADYVRWELTLLRDLGYGLDLSACALTGDTELLAFVSPNSGRAVTAAAAAPWRDRLLALPAFLTDEAAQADPGAIRQGLALTGWFLERYVYAPEGRRIPPARLRLVEGF